VTGDVITSVRPRSTWRDFMALRKELGPLDADLLADRTRSSITPNSRSITLNHPNDSEGVMDTAAASAASIAAELSATLDSAAELARAAARLADQRVRERPWQTVALAAALGVLVGLCVRGR
jgi:hypothetical protein